MAYWVNVRHVNSSIEGVHRDPTLTSLRSPSQELFADPLTKPNAPAIFQDFVGVGSAPRAGDHEQVPRSDAAAARAVHGSYPVVRDLNQRVWQKAGIICAAGT
jgi:hypothetical protein